MAPETALAVEFWPIADLVPNPRNARVHSEEQVAQIRRSIEEFGFTNPVLLGDIDGEIVAGHGRRMAAQAIYADGGTIHLPGGRPIPAGTVPPGHFLISVRGVGHGQSDPDAGEAPARG